MPFRKCSFCCNHNKLNKTVNYFKITQIILDYLALPDEYGQFICSEHFCTSDIENNKLKPLSVPIFLHHKSNKDIGYGQASCSNLLGNVIIYGLAVNVV